MNSPVLTAPAIYAGHDLADTLPVRAHDVENRDAGVGGGQPSEQAAASSAKWSFGTYPSAAQQRTATESALRSLMHCAANDCSEP